MAIKDLKREQIQAIICIFLLLGTTVAVFEYTVEIRKPYFGELSDGLHVWLTASTLKFAKNWYYEGPLNLKFGMFENPRSIEFQNLSSRKPYLSYLPGSIIPIYSLSVITGQEPNVPLIMYYNLFNHFLIAFLLSLTIFIFLRQIKVDLLNSFLFSTLPIFLELLLPAPLYWHQNVFFSDQAVILPFVLYVFLEVIIDGLNDRYIRVLGILQNLVLFYGFLTDWLFVFVALMVFLKRIFEGKIQFNRKIGTFLKEGFKFWLAPLIAIIILLYQIFSWDRFGLVYNKVIFRTGITNKGVTVPPPYHWVEGFINGYGEIGLYALCFALAVVVVVLLFVLLQKLLKKETDLKIKRICALMSILLIPCILQVITFKNHSLMHSFSILKFSVPLATIPFVLAPVSLYLILKSNIKIPNIKFNLSKNLKVDVGFLIIFLLVFSAASIYLVNEHPHYKQYWFKAGNPHYNIFGNSIRENTNYDDIIFSPNVEISFNPPQQISYSMKRVYKINSTEDIGRFTKGLSGYHIVILFWGYPSEKWEKELENATMVQDGNCYYYRLN
ncbi:MAG: hypothetical protein A4E25_00360 [Methanobacterium sp. PtaB.Bin024]|jgi:hypothetical protein|nr:MAG: hypothetical protein A4E25_00360 [Methanobacterium sp. PtaB.Bin024]